MSNLNAGLVIVLCTFVKILNSNEIYGYALSCRSFTPLPPTLQGREGQGWAEACGSREGGGPGSRRRVGSGRGGGAPAGEEAPWASTKRRAAAAREDGQQEGRGEPQEEAAAIQTTREARKEMTGPGPLGRMCGTESAAGCVNGIAACAGYMVAASAEPPDPEYGGQAPRALLFGAG